MNAQHVATWADAREVARHRPVYVHVAEPCRAACCTDDTRHDIHVAYPTGRVIRLPFACECECEVMRPQMKEGE